VFRPPSAAARAEVEAMGVRVEVVRLGLAGALPALARALGGDRRPVQTLLYARRRAAARVQGLIAAGSFDVVHAQLVRTLAYLPAERPRVVVDLIDALSRNLARRARLEGALRGRVLAWEAARLARAEAELLGRGTPCLVVSEGERAALPARGDVRVVPNGVDTAAFPFDGRARPAARLVFGGNLGYFPNVDAAGWLARDVLPRIRTELPTAELCLVGARPARAVQALGTAAGVTVTGAVPAMAPELAKATVAVIPLRGGSGLQNKVLEAMAVGTPVVATPLATAGLDVTPGEHLLVAEDAAGLAAATLALCRDPARARAMAHAARALVEARYRWEASAAAVEAAWMDAAAP
jgi:glycosyltransferase involved in cell wall biosynthesis